MPAAGGPWLGVRSSGSTGQPKIVWRRWCEVLSEASHDERLRGWVWASPFQPWTFAGVQVALQAWASQGRVISLDNQWTDSCQRLVAEPVDALSCTPTYLDLLLQNEPSEGELRSVECEISAKVAESPRSAKSSAEQEPKSDAARSVPRSERYTPQSAVRTPHWETWQPKQITLGGEPLRPALGNRLRRRFTQARVTVIYAAAEFGVLLKTRRLDGWYEAEGLTKRYPHWRITDGQLELRRNDAWISTGDRVEVKDGLLRILGRADAVANVAGTKISLADVARLAEEVPGVRHAQAVAEANPLTGQIVSLRYAVEARADQAAVTQTLETHLRRHLPKAAWPRRWELQEIQLGPNAKRR